MQMTQEQARVEKKNEDKPLLKPRFNMELIPIGVNVVLLNQGCSSNKVITVPFMTNEIALEKGEELWLHIPDAAQKVSPKEVNWRQKRVAVLKDAAAGAGKKQKTDRK